MKTHQALNRFFRSLAHNTAALVLGFASVVQIMVPVALANDPNACVRPNLTLPLPLGSFTEPFNAIAEHGVTEDKATQVCSVEDKMEELEATSSECEACSEVRASLKEKGVNLKDDSTANLTAKAAEGALKGTWFAVKGETVDTVEMISHFLSNPIESIEKGLKGLGKVAGFLYDEATNVVQAAAAAATGEDSFYHAYQNNPKAAVNQVAELAKKAVPMVEQSASWFGCLPLAEKISIIAAAIAGVGFTASFMIMKGGLIGGLSRAAKRGQLGSGAEKLFSAIDRSLASYAEKMGFAKRAALASGKAKKINAETKIVQTFADAEATGKVRNDVLVVNRGHEEVVIFKQGKDLYEIGTDSPAAQKMAKRYYETSERSQADRIANAQAVREAELYHKARTADLKEARQDALAAVEYRPERITNPSQQVRNLDYGAGGVAVVKDGDRTLVYAREGIASKTYYQITDEREIKRLADLHLQEQASGLHVKQIAAGLTKPIVVKDGTKEARLLANAVGNLPEEADLTASYRAFQAGARGGSRSMARELAETAPILDSAFAKIAPGLSAEHRGLIAVNALKASGGKVPEAFDIIADYARGRNSAPNATEALARAFRDDPDTELAEVARLLKENAEVEKGGDNLTDGVKRGLMAARVQDLEREVVAAKQARRIAVFEKANPRLVDTAIADFKKVSGEQPSRALVASVLERKAAGKGHKGGKVTPKVEEDLRDEMRTLAGSCRI